MSPSEYPARPSRQTRPKSRATRRSFFRMHAASFFNLSRIAVFFSLCLVSQAVGVSRVAAADQDSFALTPRTTIRFATQRQGQELLARPDSFLKSLSRFDLEIRVRKVEATAEQLLTTIRDDVVGWEPADQARFLGILASLQPKLIPFHIPWPAEIWLVRTRGNIESGAAYCRQEAVVIPERMDRMGPEELERLLTHELFHVMSNQNPQLRKQLYQIVGFDQMQPLELPASLADRKITNPDAPTIDCYLWVVHQGEVLPAAPLLVARSSYQSDGPQSLFALLQFQLVALQPHEPTTNEDTELPRFDVRWHEGQPLLLSPDRACLFWNIGVNTNYIIHPEEVLADNFVFLVHQRSGLPTPRIVESLESLLRAP